MEISVFLYSPKRKGQTSADMLSVCGNISFDNSHHQYRNSGRLSVDKEKGLLSEFRGTNYKHHLNELFQEGSTDFAGVSIFDKDQRLSDEINSWASLSSPIMDARATAVFDIGVCGAAAPLRLDHDDWRPYHCTLLDTISLQIESQRVTNMLEKTSRLSVEDLALGGGFTLVWNIARDAYVQQCGTAVVAGSAGSVSRCRRLVVEDRRLAWLADMHHSYDFRRIVFCDHILQIVGKFDHSETKEKLSDSFVNLTVSPVWPFAQHHANRIMKTLRGACCDHKMSFQRATPQDSLSFTDARSKWKAVIELIAIRPFVSMPEPDNRPAGEVLEMLKCGMAIPYCFLFSVWKNDGAEKIDGERLISDIERGSFEISTFINAAGCLEAIEMLSWIDTVLKFREISKAEEHGGLFGIDVHALQFQNNPDEIFANVDDEDEMFSYLDRIIIAATGVENLAKLEPLCLAQKYQPAGTLAAHFDNLNRKTLSNADDMIVPGESWLLDEETAPSIKLEKDGVLHVVEIVPTNTVISYKSERTTRIKRILAKIFKGVSIKGVGVNVDLSPLYAAGAVDTSNTVNGLLKGDFGVEGLRYGLWLIFSGLVRVKRGLGSPTCYVPAVAHADDGLVITAFLPPDLMSQATYFERRGKVYWLPGKGMNIFEVQTLGRSKTTHFKEIFDHIEVVEEVGPTKILFKVG